MMNREVKSYSTMTEKESIKSFCEGLRKAASCARELAADTEDAGWKQIAEILDGMRENGFKLSRMRAMSRVDQMKALALKAGFSREQVNMNPLKPNG